MNHSQQADTPLPLCEEAGKAKYASEHAARNAIKAIKRNRREGWGAVLHAYRCGSHWHVGHTDPGNRTKSKAKRNGRRRRST